MPIYEYTCQKCNHVFDHLARNQKDVAKQCPSCGAAKLTKGLSSFVARVPTPATRACDTCRTSPTCPTAGKFGCGGACGQ
ncbi:MAG: zinc ribbon domain-containing protein [bacterium]